VLSFAADSAAAPEVAWRLIAEPPAWPRWAPHIRGARGLGAPEVEPGRHGVAFVGIGFGGIGVPVPVHIVGKAPGVSWAWQLGPARFRHAVDPLPGGGCRVLVEVSAPAALEGALRFSYGPLIAVLVRNLARVAAASDG
jgi:hypothetical protein